MKSTGSFENNKQEPTVFKGGEIAHRPGVYRQKGTVFNSRIIVVDSKTRLYVTNNGCCTLPDSWFSNQYEYIEVSDVVTLTFQN